MRDGSNEERIAVDPRALVPRWFLIGWDCFCLTLFVLAAVSLGLSLPLLLFVFVVPGLLVGKRLLMWSLADRPWNYAEFGDESIRVVVGHPRGWRTPVIIPYSSVQRVEAHSEFPIGPLWVWPLKPLGKTC